MKKFKETLLSILGLLICAAIGMTVESCNRHEIPTTPEEQAEIDTVYANQIAEQTEWADPNAFVKAYTALSKDDSVRHVIYSLPEETLCAVVNVVKRSHAKFTSEDVAKEYLAHKDIYDETQKVKEEPRAGLPNDTLSYDTVLNGIKVHVTEYTKIK